MRQRLADDLGAGLALTRGTSIELSDLVERQAQSDHLGGLRSTAGAPASSLLQRSDVMARFRLGRPRADLFVGSAAPTRKLLEVDKVQRC